MKDFDDSNGENNPQLTYVASDQPVWIRYKVYHQAGQKQNHALLFPGQTNRIDLFFNGHYIGNTHDDLPLFIPKEKTGVIKFPAGNRPGKPATFTIPGHLITEGENIIAIYAQSLNGIAGFRENTLTYGPHYIINERWVQKALWSAGEAFSFFFVALLFFIYYINQRKSFFFLNFSLMSAVLGIWLLSYRGYSFYFFDHYLTDILGTSLGGVLSTPLLFYFLHNFFNQPKTIITRILESGFYFFSFFILIEYIATGQNYYFINYAYSTFMLWVTSGIIYSFYITTLALRANKESAGLMLGGLSFLGLSVMAMIIVETLRLDFPLVLGEGYFAMTFVMSTILATRYKKITTKLQVAQEDLEELEKIKDRFYSTISDELQTPINEIYGLSKNLLNSKLESPSPRQQEMLEMIIQNSHHMENLVNDLVEAAKLHNKGVILEQAPTNLQKVINHAVALNLPLLSGKKIKIINEIPANLPPAYIDENRLLQVMTNLTHNAIKHTRQGKIKINAKIQATNKKQNYIEIHIADARKISDTINLKNIFDPFLQASSNHMSPDKNRMTLQICQNLIELHGGTIWAEPNPGGGLVFSFTVPIAPTNKEISGEKSSLQKLKTSKGQKKNKTPKIPENTCTIILGDDELVHNYILIDSLKDSGYNVIHCNTTEQVLEEFNNTPSVDLIIIAPFMPGKTYLEVIQTIRKTHSKEELPIFLITGQNHRKELKTGLEAGANDYIIKPLISNELISRIEHYLTIKNKSSTQDQLNAIYEEMSLAKKLDSAILPAPVPKLDSLDFFMVSDSKYKKGSDYYDFLKIDDQRFGFILYDISTFGMTATVVSAMIKITFVQLEALADSPSHLVTQLNFLLADYLEQFFITLSYCYFDMDEKSVTYATAGQMPLILYRDSEKRCLEYETHGNAVGLNTDMPIESRTIPLKSGDKIVVYTDGLIMAKNKKNETFDDVRLIDLIRRNPEKNNEELGKFIINTIKKWTGANNYPQDDITLVIVDVK